MRLSPISDKQLLDVIQWSEPEAGTLAYRYPMLDTEIEAGAWLQVGEWEMALLVDEERGADIFGPGMYALNAGNLPVLAGVKNWGKGFALPFKSDIYFFSMREEIDQKWGTGAPALLRDKENGQVRVRGYGSYSYRVTDVRRFFAGVSGTRESYLACDLDDRLRRIIVARIVDTFSSEELAADAGSQSEALVERIKPVFAALGLELMRFSVGSLSLEDESQSSLDERMGMRIAGNLETAEARNHCVCCGASMRAEYEVLKCDYCHAIVVAGAGDDASAVFAEGSSAEFQRHACAVCEIPLMQATVGGASLLYCTRCDGMLVEMEEFEALVAASRALTCGPLPAMKTAGTRKPVSCPECRRAMGTSFYGGDLAISSCEDCGLNWLDHWELARIAHGAVSEYGPEVDGAGVYMGRAHASSSFGLNLGT